MTFNKKAFCKGLSHELTIFSGEKDALPMFLRSVALSLEDCPPEQLSKMLKFIQNRFLPANLSDKLESAKIVTIIEFQTALKSALSSNQSVNEICDEIAYVKQSTHEKIIDFADRVRQYETDLEFAFRRSGFDETLITKLVENTLFNAFIKNLRNKLKLIAISFKLETR